MVLHQKFVLHYDESAEPVRRPVRPVGSKALTGGSNPRQFEDGGDVYRRTDGITNDAHAHENGYGDPVNHLTCSERFTL